MFLVVSSPAALTGPSPPKSYPTDPSPRLNYLGGLDGLYDDVP